MRLPTCGPDEWLAVTELSRPAVVTVLAVTALAVLGVVEVTRQWLAARRRRRTARILTDANRSYAVALAGLRTMAEVVTGLPEVPPALSRRGVRLLDGYAEAAASFRHLLGRARTMSRDRAQRHLAREFLKLQANEPVFRQFQREVLRVASAQALSGVVEPPVPLPRYRAAFTVLRHALPREVWPVAAEVLAAAVEFTLQERGGRWHPVPVRFVNGGQAVFSRRFLERAVALRMVIRGPGREPRVFEYEVEHELPVRAPGRLARRLARFLPAPKAPPGGGC